jgi:hypothetical protein
MEFEEGSKGLVEFPPLIPIPFNLLEGKVVLVEDIFPDTGA